MYIANPEKSSPFPFHTWKNTSIGPHEKPFAAAANPGTAQRSGRSDRTTARSRDECKKAKKRDRVCFYCFCGVYYISSLFLRNPERWLSGRRRRSRKPLTGYSRSGVRIPLSPPFLEAGPPLRQCSQLRLSTDSGCFPAFISFSLFGDFYVFRGGMCLQSAQITLTQMLQTGCGRFQ